MNQFNDEEFIQLLMEVRERDYDAFIHLVLESLKTFPDFAIEDDAPVEKKMSALDLILNHLEEQEDYEDCAFIRDLKEKIEDAAKG